MNLWNIFDGLMLYSIDNYWCWCFWQMDYIFQSIIMFLFPNNVTFESTRRPLKNVIFLIYWHWYHCVLAEKWNYVCICIAKSCWLLWFECSVHVSDGFPKNKVWMESRWVRWALSKLCLDFFLNFAKGVFIMAAFVWGAHEQDFLLRMASEKVLLPYFTAAVCHNYPRLARSSPTTQSRSVRNAWKSLTMTLIFVLSLLTGQFIRLGHGQWATDVRRLASRDKVSSSRPVLRPIPATGPWIAAIAWSRTSLSTQTAAMCVCF